MKKYLLLTSLFISASISAQIIYWDFGAKELGAGYTNALPLEHLNAFANYTRNIDWVDANGVSVTNHADGVAYAAKDGYQNENGQSVAAIFNSTFMPPYDAMPNFQVSSKGSSPTPPGGTLLGGGSQYTKPQMMPDLDGSVDLVFKRDSNSDRLITTRTDITRYEDRVDMPDGMDKELFPGCLQYTTPGEKRYNRSGGRGLLINLEAGQWVTVIGSGQYSDIDPENDVTGSTEFGYQFSTGYVKFETFGGTGTPVEYNDWGSGRGAPEGPLDNTTDTGDEAVRVMQFQAIDAGTYSLSNRGGTIRIYRVYLGKVDVSLGAGLETKIYENGVYARTLAAPKNLLVFPQISANKNRVLISDVTEETKVNVYSITGALVKSIKTQQNTDFNLNSGLYIFALETAKGKKAVKFIVK